MKRILPFILLISLCACAKPDTSAYNEYRGRDVLIEARITQKGEELENVYRVRYDGNSECGTVTILEPESISGISARVEEGKANFDDIILLTEEPSPLGAIQRVLNAWQNEPIEYGSDGGNTLLVFENVRCAFSETAPIYSEILLDGREVLHVEFIKSEVKK